MEVPKIVARAPKITAEGRIYLFKSMLDVELSVISPFKLFMKDIETLFFNVRSFWALMAPLVGSSRSFRYKLHPTSSMSTAIINDPSIFALIFGHVLDVTSTGFDVTSKNSFSFILARYWTDLAIVCWHS